MKPDQMTGYGLAQELRRVRTHIPDVMAEAAKRLEEQDRPTLATRPADGAAVPAGWKLLKDTTYEERCWPEDSSHENGAYSCCCVDCGRMFTGHKRRVVCKSCAATPKPQAEPATPVQPEVMTACPHGAPHRWPCEKCDVQSAAVPTVEAGQGERERFEVKAAAAGMDTRRLPPGHGDGSEDYVRSGTGFAWTGWQLRAALSSPAPVQQEQAERVALTVGQIVYLTDEIDPGKGGYVLRIARVIESAHGIKESGK